MCPPRHIWCFYCLCVFTQTHLLQEMPKRGREKIPATYAFRFKHYEALVRMSDQTMSHKDLTAP